MMKPKIPEPLLSCLREIGEVGGNGTYLVGGLVRDLLLERKSLDIDIVVEGNAFRVAEAMRERWNGTLNVHPNFGTATVTPENPEMPKVDFVAARRETYQHPGTLPIVKQGTIDADLRRRDFTINALAMRLDADAFGTIVDPGDGMADLGTGTIRVLHQQSYIDDPTRIFRACRYAGRYGFHIADGDKVLIREALPVLLKVSGERIRNDINRILQEENVPQIVQLLTEFDVWRKISIGWDIGENFDRRFAEAQQAITWVSEHLPDEPFYPEIVRWMTLFKGNLDSHWLEAISFRLVLPHQLLRLGGKVPEDVSFENEEFQDEELSLSQHVTVASHNGKWLIVDAENHKTYVRADGRFYQVLTPLTTHNALLLPVLFLLSETPTLSEIHNLLKSYPLEASVLAMHHVNVEPLQREQIGNYLRTVRQMEPLVTGRDLIEWGEKPGKAFETFLSRLFSAQLDGKITTKSEAHRWLQALKKDSAEAVSEKS